MDPARAERSVIADLIQLGFLQPFIEDPNAEEITVNGPRVWVHWRDRGKELIQDLMPDDEEIIRLSERRWGWPGAVWMEHTPAAEVALLDGSRLTAVIPPSSLFRTI